MKILKDITIESYLNLLNSENNTFKKIYSEELGFDSEEYRRLFTDEELMLDILGIADSEAPELINTPDAKNDFENSRRIFEWLKNLSIADANDIRFWTTLTHLNYSSYTRNRWKIDRKSTNETIKQRYFYIGSGLQARLRNSISRLWWIAKLTVKEELPDKYAYTEIVWSSQDLMQNLFERSLGTYPNIRFGFLKFYAQRKGVYDSKQFRVFYKEINAMGAMTPLNLLTESAVLEFLYRVEKAYYPELEINLTSQLENLKIDTHLSQDSDTDFQGHESDKREFSEEQEYMFSEKLIFMNDSNNSNNADDSIDINLSPVVYVKKLNDQDIERTPSICKEAVINFLKINLKNDEEVKLRCYFKGNEIEVELKKRKTRNEYRLFLNKFRNLIEYNKNDLLEFRYKSGKLTIEIIKYSFNISQNPRYKDYNSRLGKKFHLLL